LTLLSFNLPCWSNSSSLMEKPRLTLQQHTHGTHSKPGLREQC
jgi:hypothetical protein